MCLSVCVCVGMRRSHFSLIKKKHLEFIKYILYPSHYRRENLFLKALMVLAIMGAISAEGVGGGGKKPKQT